MQPLVEDTDLSDKLFSVVRTEAIHPTLAGYFSKVFVSLLRSAEEAVLKVLKDEHLSKDFLRHLNSRSITEALSKVVCQVDRLYPSYVPMREDIITQVVAFIESSQSYETCNNAAYLLLELINNREVTYWAELIKALCQREVLQKLLDQLACPEVYVVKAAVSVLEALCNIDVLSSLSKGSVQDEDSTLMEDEQEVPVLIELLTSKANDLSEILKQSSRLSRTSTFKVTLPTLGEGRLKVIELVNAVLRIDNAALMASIAKSNLVEVITALFQEFKWNSILHGAYEKLVLTVVQSNSVELKANLLVKGRLPAVLTSILETQEKYGNGVTMKTGQAGHVTRISNILVNAGRTQDSIQSLLDADSHWRQFTDEIITPQNELEARSLGGKEHDRFQSITSEEDFIDIKPGVRPR
jgi:hypothetical protein